MKIISRSVVQYCMIIISNDTLSLQWSVQTICLSSEEKKVISRVSPESWRMSPLPPIILMMKKFAQGQKNIENQLTIAYFLIGSLIDFSLQIASQSRGF